MTVFAVMFEGRGIRVPTDGEAEPIIGFFTTRVVRAKSPDSAIEIAKALILQEWETGKYEQTNTGSLPELSVEMVSRPSWYQMLFRRIPTKGYSFYSLDD